MDKIDEIRATVLAEHDANPGAMGVGCDGCNYCDCGPHHAADAEVIAHLLAEVKRLSEPIHIARFNKIYGWCCVAHRDMHENKGKD